MYLIAIFARIILFQILLFEIAIYATECQALASANGNFVHVAIPIFFANEKLAVKPPK